MSAWGARDLARPFATPALGLMLAMRAQLETRRGVQGWLDAFLHVRGDSASAVWAGLEPLLCDIDLETWFPDTNAEDDLLDRRMGDCRACALCDFRHPAGSGTICRADRDAQTGLVIDAATRSAASIDLAQVSAQGSNGRSSSQCTSLRLFSSEAGLVYSSDRALIRSIRVMSNFGFGEPRHATMLGLNAKLSEVGALIASLRLHGFNEVIGHRERLFKLSRARLPQRGFQAETGMRQAHQFVPVLLPERDAGRRDGIVEALRIGGIGTQIFQPHLAEQAYFKETAKSPICQPACPGERCDAPFGYDD